MNIFLSAVYCELMNWIMKISHIAHIHFDEKTSCAQILVLKASVIVLFVLTFLLNMEHKEDQYFYKHLRVYSVVKHVRFDVNFYKGFFMFLISQFLLVWFS